MQDDYLKMRIESDLYNNFQETCKNKGKTMSGVLRSFINSYIKSENTILLDIDNDTLYDTLKLCKEKKIKLNDLIKIILKKTIKDKEL